MTKACLCALAVSLVTTGCSDLLDKEPPSAISDGSFWTGEGDAMLALTGCYRFQTGWSHDDFATPQGLLYLDFAGGNGTEKENFSTLRLVPIRWLLTVIYVGIGEMHIRK